MALSWDESKARSRAIVKKREDKKKAERMKKRAPAIKAAQAKKDAQTKKNKLILGPINLGGAYTDIATEKRKGSIIPKKVTKKTKGGEYPVYKKKSASAVGFRQAFAAARKARLAGKNSFTIDGQKFPLNKKGDFKLNNRSYNSMTADDNKKAKAAAAKKSNPVSTTGKYKPVVKPMPKAKTKPKNTTKPMPKAKPMPVYEINSKGVPSKRYSSTVIARSGATPDAKGLAREKAMSNKLDGEMDAFKKRAAKRKKATKRMAGGKVKKENSKSVTYGSVPEFNYKKGGAVKRMSGGKVGTKTNHGTRGCKPY